MHCTDRNILSRNNKIATEPQCKQRMMRKAELEDVGVLSLRFWFGSATLVAKDERERERGRERSPCSNNQINEISVREGQ